LRLADITNLVCNVVVQEHCFYLVLYRVLIQHEVPLGEAIVVVQLIHFFSFSEAIINVLLDVKGVHEAELGRSTGVKQFLLEGISVLPVVEDSLAIACAHQPLVVWLEVADLKRVDGAVETH